MWGIWFLFFIFFHLKSCFQAELINYETLFYKGMCDMQDTKQFSSHESVQVTPVLSLYCIIHRPPHPPPHEEKDEKSCEEPEFFIYLFIFISCPSSKLKANHREADFHLHSSAIKLCHETFFKHHAGRSSKQASFKGNLIPFSLGAVQMRSGQSHPGLPPHPFEMVERASPPDPSSHFSVHQGGFHSTCAVAALVSPFAARRPCVGAKSIQSAACSLRRPLHPDSQTPLQLRITACRIPFPLLNIPASL